MQSQFTGLVRRLSENYHPVSLNSIIVKTLERLNHVHIMTFLTDFKLLSDIQKGFKQFRSCVTSLSNFFTDDSRLPLG